MRTRKAALGLLGPAAALALPLALGMPATASADTPTVYQATLNPLNGSGGSGTFSMDVTGNEATITEHVEGIAQKYGEDAYPHVQHIHIGGMHECPGPDADGSVPADGNDYDDGIIDTVEGQAAYGEIGTTLSTEGDTGPGAATDISIAPAGGKFDYSRTLTLSDATVNSLKDGTAVVVVHGLDPANAGSNPSADNRLGATAGGDTLPIAATAPTLCGPVNASPVSGSLGSMGSNSGSMGSGSGSMGSLQSLFPFGFGSGSMS